MGEALCDRRVPVGFVQARSLLEFLKRAVHSRQLRKKRGHLQPIEVLPEQGHVGPQTIASASFI